MRNLTIPVLAAFAGLAAAPTVASAERVVLSEGHTDVLDVAFANGAFDVDVRDDTVGPAVLRDPDDVIFHATPESEFAIPEDLPPEFAFLGNPGDRAWLLPQSQEPGVLFPGWETNRVPAGVLAGDEMRFHLLDVDGPGRFQLFTVGSFGEPTLLLNSTDGLPDAMSVPVFTHAHANWAFSAPGTYTLTFEVTGEPVGGAEVSSGPVDYRFFVGERADLPVVPETALSVDGLAASYVEGETVTLRAVQAPDTGLDDYRWTTRCENGAAFTSAGSGATLTFPAQVARDGCQYRVALRGAGGARVASSAPVTLRVRSAPPAGGAPPPGVAPPLGGGAPVAERLSLRASAARVSGRTLRLRLRVSAASRVTVSVRRRGRTIARTKPRSVQAGDRVVRLRLGRRLAAGRYTVRIRAVSGDEVGTRTIALRVR